MKTVIMVVCFMMICVVAAADYSSRIITDVKEGWVYYKDYKWATDINGKQVEIVANEARPIDDRRISDLEEDRQNHLDRAADIQAFIDDINAFEIAPK